jgi:hypothetical protein
MLLGTVVAREVYDFLATLTGDLGVMVLSLSVIRRLKVSCAKCSFVSHYGLLCWLVWVRPCCSGLC